VDAIPDGEITREPVVILADPILREELVLIPLPDPNVRTPVDVIPNVLPQKMVPPVVILPFPKLRDDPFVVIPPADPK